MTASAQQSDPNVYIPPQARAQIAAGRAMEKELTGHEPEPPPPVGRNDAELQTEKREPFILPKQDPPAPQPVATEPPGKDQAGLLPEDPEPELPLETVPKQAFDKLVAQHQTLQGKYVAEGERMRAQLQTLQDQVARLTAAPPVAAAPLTTDQSKSKITEEEVREYGPDLIDIIGRKAQEIADQMIKDQLGPLVNRVDAVAKTAADVKGDRFRTYMDSNVQDWRKTDHDAGFIEWLTQDDPFSGIRRGEILKMAMGNDDFPRVKMIFEGYASETAAIAPQKRTDTVKSTGSVKLDTLAAPASTRGRTEAIVDNSAPEAMTGDEIAAYFRRKLDPRSKLPKAEIDAMEARISRAVKAGLVQSRSHL